MTQICVGNLHSISQKIILFIFLIFKKKLAPLFLLLDICVYMNVFTISVISKTQFLKQEFIN